MTIIFIFLWFLIGCVIAIPYTYLAGDGGEGILSFLSTAWISPVGAIIVYLVFTFSNKKEVLKAGIVGIYFCLPIILNWLSKFAGILGYNELKSFFFDIRYPSLVYVLLLISTLTVIRLRVKVQKKKKRLRGRIPGN